MKTISLTQGKVALVDDADYAWLNQYKWHAFRSHGSYTFYAVRKVRVAGNKRRLEMMHRVVLGLSRDNKLQADHKDSNGLNNQQSNLRVCTHTQNQQSQRKLTVGTSKYKGVRWFARDRKWYSRIRVEKKLRHLGCFDLEKDAARAYDAAALKHFGEFALTNEMLGLI